MQLNSLPALFVFLSAVSSLTFPPKTQEPLIDSSQSHDFHEIIHALKEASIIPTILPDFTPKCYVSGYYKKNKRISLGSKIKNKKTKSKPSLNIYCPDMISTPGLTIALTDPDAPSKEDPKWGEMCHWIAITGAFALDESFEAELEFPLGRDDVVKYKPPGPPKGTGFHRYVFVLLEGDNSNLTAPSDRQHWGMGQVGGGVKEWAEIEGLSVIGANWFVQKQKQND